MKLVSTITELIDSDQDGDFEPVVRGKIWTDGRKVYCDPPDNELLQSLATDPVDDRGQKVMPSEAGRFVRALCTNYRFTVMASPAVEEK